MDGYIEKKRGNCRMGIICGGGYVAVAEPK